MEKLSKNMLWVDIDVDVIGSLTKNIEKAGSRVIKVPTIEQGVKQIQKKPFGLVLTELILGEDKWTKKFAKKDIQDYRGVDFIEYLSQNYPDTPIGVLSVVNEFTGRASVGDKIAFYLNKGCTLPSELADVAKLYLL